MNIFDTDNVTSSDNENIINPNNVPNVKRKEEVPASYDQVKAALIKSHPDALTMDELNRLTGIKQSEVLMATNYGLVAGEMLRDATYYPARYTVNSERVDLAPESNATETEVVEAKPVKKTRQSGIFKEIVTYLVKTGEHLTPDEILFKAGIRTNRQAMSSMLSTQYAKKAISREAGSVPYKYFVDGKLKEQYIAKFGINVGGEADMARKKNESVETEQNQEKPTRISRRRSTGPKPIIKKSRGLHVTEAAVTAAAEPLEALTVVEPVQEPQSQPVNEVNEANIFPQAVSLNNAAPQAASFNAFIDLDGVITLVIDGKPVQLSAEQTRKLVRMIKFAAE